MAQPGRRTDIAEIKRMIKDKRPIVEVSEKAENLQQLKFAKLYHEVTQRRRLIQDIEVQEVGKLMLFTASFQKFIAP